MAQIRDLAFLPHLFSCELPWRRIRFDHAQNAFNLDDYQWQRVIHDPTIVVDGHPGCTTIGDALLNHRLHMSQTVPTRLRTLFSWNLNSWNVPKRSIQDPKMRRCKKMLATGPVLLVIYQHMPGVQIASTVAFPSRNERWSGGVAILLPAGWTICEEIVLLKGRAVAALVKDRSLPFYLISVYLHPDHVKKELEDILNAWRNVEKKSQKVVVAGDFNHVDEHHPDLWNRWLSTIKAFDVHPTLVTYTHARGLSPLDRCLVPEEWVSSARWNPVVKALHTNSIYRHRILPLNVINVMVTPTVLNNPDPGVLMPGKDDVPVKDNLALHGLVRLLHREHYKIF